MNVQTKTVGRALTGVIIRPATAFDTVNIARLMRASWEDSPAARVAQVNDLRAIEHVTGLLKGSHVVVADLSGRLIGALACALIRERWSNPDDWFLCDEWFAISPHWVTRGIAEQLLVEVETFAQRERLPLMLGASLISVPLDPLLNQRPGYQRLGAQYLRMPQVMVGDGIETATQIEAQSA